MYNFFSFIWIHFRKWTDGTRKDIVKMILTVTVFLSCFWVLVQWNTVPHYEDNVVIETYRDKSVTNDSLTAYISIRRPYQTFYSLRKDSAGYEVGFIGSYNRDSTEFIGHNENVDSLLDILKTKEPSLSMDSIAVLFNVKAKIHLYISLMSNSANRRDSVYNMTDKACFAVTSFNAYDSINRGFANTEILGIFKDKSFSEKDKPLFLLSPSIKNKINTNSSPLYKILFTMCDFSQCYYEFKVKKNNYDMHISSLNIDFGGATRFSGIYPVPDCTTSTGIRYTDKDKLLHIESYGIKFYCQFLESSAVQSLRAYAVTTVATFFFTLFLKILLEVIWRKIKGLGNMFIRKHK